MKWQKYFLIVFTLITTATVAYLTYIYRSTGVPFYRHNEVYDIVRSDTLSTDDPSIKNYTEPFKKYSLIDEEELNFTYSDTFEFDIINQNNRSLIPKE